MRRVLFLLPAILSPYLLIGFFVLMYCSPLFVHTVAGGNIFVVIAVLFAFFFIAVISTVLYFILALTQRWDSLSVAKTAMLIKLIHIPAYVIIFVLGFLFVLTIWLMLFTVLLAILDYVFLLMTGAVNIAAVINASKEGKCSFKSNLWVVILQFIFCADVVASIIFYFKLRKISKNGAVIEAAA